MALLINYANIRCSPIQTYSGLATLKPDLPNADQHAIIHTSRNAPAQKWYYANDGVEVVRENLTKDPIRVEGEQRDPEGDLGDASRIDYSKIYTVEHCVRVLNIGMVLRDSMGSLIANSRIQPKAPTALRLRPVAQRRNVKRSEKRR